MKQKQRVTTFLQDHLVLVAIICVAAFLRFYALSTHTIFFGDAGKDLLAAHTAYQNGSFPLVGIASSRPYLHQGPFSMWLSMAGFVFFGTSTTAQAYLFALCGVFAVIALYELTVNYLNRATAYTATALFAVFPLAVAHARMPYHTTLIPLATTFFLWGITNWYTHPSLKNGCIAAGAYLVLCGTELSNLPLALLLVFPYLRQILKKKRAFFAGIPGIDRAMHSLPLIPETLSQFHFFAMRIVSVYSHSVIYVVYGALAYICVASWHKRTSMPQLMIATLLSCAVLIIAYCVNGQVSEAYMPPFFILFAISGGYAVHLLLQQGVPQYVVWTLITFYMLFSSYQIYHHNFFVGQGAFVYESTGEIQKIASVIAQKTHGHPYRLTTTDGIELRVESYFDNLRWIQKEYGLQQPRAQGKTLYLVPKGSQQPPDSYLLAHFTTQSLYAQIGEP